MAEENDDPKVTGSMLDRRTVIALVAGGAAALSSGAAAAAPSRQAQGVVAEHEWARTLARQISVQLPEAARQLPGLGLTSDQIEQLQRAFENTLVTNMGCGLPPVPGS